MIEALAAHPAVQHAAAAGHPTARLVGVGLIAANTLLLAAALRLNRRRQIRP